MKNAITNVLNAAISETRTDLTLSGDQISRSVIELASQLSLIVGQPGYQQAAVAARDEIALDTGLAAVSNVDGAVVRGRQRIIGVIQASLGLAAQLAVTGEDS